MRGLWSLVLLPLWAAVLFGSISEAKPPRAPSYALREARKKVVVRPSAQVVRQKNPRGQKKPTSLTAKAPQRKASKRVAPRPKPVVRNRPKPPQMLYKSKRRPQPKKPVAAKPVKRVAIAARATIRKAKAKAPPKRSSLVQRGPHKKKHPAQSQPRKKALPKLVQRKAPPQAATPKAQVSSKKNIQGSANRKASLSRVMKKPMSMFEAHRASFLRKEAFRKARKAADVPATAAAATAAAAAGPANMIPSAGKHIDVKDSDAFVKEFTIEFKVKFDNFTKNSQMLVSTDRHALEIQALGPKYQENATKIGAYMRTESGLGPDGHGVPGSDGRGQLMSHALSPNKWYDVKFQKTPTLLSLTVDGQTVASAINTHVIIKDTDFDLEAGSTKLVAGKMAGAGDIGLNGQLADLIMIEGSPTTAETVDAAPASGATEAAPSLAALTRKGPL